MATDAIHAPNGAKSLSPLPPVIHRGLSAITAFGLLSLLSTAVLFIHLVYRLFRRDKSTFPRFHQYLILLINLLFADLQQALGFVLSLQWLADNGIFALTPSCWTQAWFLNTGDVSSCVSTLAMACHLFGDIIFDYRLSRIPFLISIAGIWTFSLFLATIGIIMHPHDFYMRAGMWCWINEEYMHERLWLHYVWILFTEFAVVGLYTTMFIVLQRRIKDFFYVSSQHQMRAESAARSVIIYPVVYVICTLPAVVARLRDMTGHSVGYAELTFVGVMMTSNGWLDVLVYALTRQSLVFGMQAPDGEDENVQGLDTFTSWDPYHHDELRDQLTDLSPPMSYGSKGRKKEQQAFNRKDSMTGLLPGDPFAKQPPVVQYYDQGLAAPQSVVRITRSEGDLRKPGMRFPRRRDPSRNVRTASPEEEKQVTLLQCSAAPGEQSKNGKTSEQRHDSIQAEDGIDPDGIGIAIDGIRTATDSIGIARSESPSTSGSHQVVKEPAERT
ncbi:unnamed protein product [Cercospora beticola]|nr:unnamed protein product [Cercospora beticola]